MVDKGMTTSPTRRKRDRSDARRLILAVLGGTVVAGLLSGSDPETGLLSWALLPLAVLLASIGRFGTFAPGVQRVAVVAVLLGMALSVVIGAVVNLGTEALGDVEAWVRHLYRSQRATIGGVVLACGCLLGAYLATGGSRRRTRRPAADVGDEGASLVTAGADFRVVHEDGWLLLEGQGWIPAGLIIGCAEPARTSDDFGHFGAAVLADDPAAPVWDGHVNYGESDDVDLAPLADHATRVLIRKVIGEAGGLVDKGRITVADPGPEGREELGRSMIGLAAGLSRPRSEHLAALVAIAGADPSPGRRRLALHRLLEDPKLDTAVERDEAIALAKGSDSPQLRALALIAEQGPAGATKVAGMAASGDVPERVLARIAANWPLEAVTTVFRGVGGCGRALPGYDGWTVDLPHERALAVMLPLLLVPAGATFHQAVRSLARIDAQAATQAILARWPAPDEPAVLGALAILKTVDAANALYEVCATGQARIATDAAAAGLVKLNQMRTEPVLLGLLARRRAKGTVSVKLVQLIAQIGGLESIQPLLELKQETSPRPEASAAAAAVQAIRARLGEYQGQLSVVEGSQLGGELSVTDGGGTLSVSKPKEGL
jgi:hypothetical protein